MKALTKATTVDSSYNYNGSTGKYLRLYTCPEGVESNMVVLYISNLSSGNATVSVSIKRGATIIPFLKDKTVAAKEYAHIWGGYVVLVPNDEVIVYAASSSFSIIATFEETSKTSLTNSGSEPVSVTV